MRVGYCGVVLPRQFLWQGFFIDDGFKSTAKRLVDATRGHLLRRDYPLGGDNPRVDAYAPGFSQNETDQMLLGALSALLCDRVQARDMNGVGAGAYAILATTSDPYFLVIGKEDPSGFVTEYRKLKATSLDAVRAEIRSSPEVMSVEAMNLLRGIKS